MVIPASTCTCVGVDGYKTDNFLTFTRDFELLWSQVTEIPAL